MIGMLIGAKSITWEKLGATKSETQFFHLYSSTNMHQSSALMWEGKLPTEPRIFLLNFVIEQSTIAACAVKESETD